MITKLEVKQEGLILPPNPIMTMYQVPEDANCLFSSLGFLLFINEVREFAFSFETTHSRIRELAISALQDLQKADTWIGSNNPDGYELYTGNNIGRTLRSLNSGGWGDMMAIRAISETFGLSIQVWRKSGDFWEREIIAPTSAYGALYEGSNSNVVLDLAWINPAAPLDPGHFVYLPLASDEKNEPAYLARDVAPLDGLLQIDPEEEDVEEARQVAVRRTAWQDDHANAISSVERLPLIDSHSHLGGLSLSGGAAKCVAKKFGKEGGQLHVRGLLKGTATSFFYYNTGTDKLLAKKLINSTKHFSREVLKQNPANVAAIALVMDMGFVALGSHLEIFGFKPSVTLGNQSTHKEIDVAEGGPLYYSRPGERNPRSFVFFPRDRDSYVKALNTVAAACKNHPAEIWPMVGFDPRRPDGVAIAKEMIPAGGYVGIKLYSRTGWMPIHNRKMYGDALGDPLDDRLNQLYAFATNKDLPLLVHCSPTGFPADDLGMLVFPWPFSKERPLLGFRQSTGRCPLGYGSIQNPLWPPSTDAGEGDDRFTAETREIIEECALEVAHYCLYVQLTTSPYAWEPVLERFPKLRLCLAHFGAEIGTYATEMRGVERYDDWQTNLELHPYVAGAGGPRNFRDLFKKAVMRKVDKKFKKSFMAIEYAVWQRDFFGNSVKWRTWLDSWNLAFPLTWHEKILEMIANPKYPNLYTDIAFVTTIKSQFSKVFGPLVDQAWKGADARAIALRSKLMIGTDWYMTEMDSCSPRDFWKMAWHDFDIRFKRVTGDGIQEAKHRYNLRTLWWLWSSENAIRWINLKDRMGDLETFYGATPKWWPTLKKHYDEGRHLETPQFRKTDPE